MSTILLVDDDPLYRDSVARALRQNGHDVTCASNGVQAIATLQKAPPDLILLDIEIPQVDGLTVLRIVRGNPDYKKIPIILLTACSERRTVMQATEHNIQGYLLKSNITVDQILAKVEKCIAEATTSSKDLRKDARDEHEFASQSSMQVTTTDEPSVEGPKSFTTLEDLTPVVTKSKLVKLVKHGLELRPLDVTVQNVMAATSSSHCSAEDVARAVANDQALSIRLLKLANSTAYSRGHPVDSVKAAVTRIGIREVRKLVMTLGVLDLYEESKSRHVDIRLFWEHSVGCGLLASAIAKSSGYKKSEDYFLWGTVHDVGRLVLLDHLSEQYAGVWDAADALGLPLEAVEPKMMIMDHCDILEYALEYWKFPREFITPVVSHHQPIHKIKRLSPDQRDAAAIISLANYLAHALLLGSSGNEVIYPLDDLIDILQLQPSMMEEIVQTVPRETNNLKFAMLARANTENWPDAASEMSGRLGTTIHPIHISREPLVNAFQIFFDRIAGPLGDNTPNLGVMYLRHANELDTLIPKYEVQEQKLIDRSLPMVLICYKGEINADQAWLKSRSYVALNTPIRVVDLLRSVNDLLNKTPERAEVKSSD